ncbi:MAG: hypothetical protein ACFFE2_12530 [Candidatus Thorarchaeota archaeon]
MRSENLYGQVSPYPLNPFFQLYGRYTGLSVFLCLMILLQGLLPCSNALELHSTLIEDLQPGVFLEYVLNTHIIVLWNYTLEDYDIITHPGEVLYDDGSVVQGSNEIRIQVSFLQVLDSDLLSISIEYDANTSTGYFANHSVFLTYSAEAGTCQIESGNLSNRTGTLRLHLDEKPEYLTISQFFNLVIVGEIVDYNYQEVVMGQQQECIQYYCSTSHVVDGLVTHHRSYDKDNHILVRASGGISDHVLLGLGNISYVVGDLTLADTNFNLGDPVRLPVSDIPAIAGVGALVVFFVLYVSIYRAQRSKKNLRRYSNRKKGKPKRCCLIFNGVN